MVVPRGGYTRAQEEMEYRCARSEDFRLRSWHIRRQRDFPEECETREYTVILSLCTAKSDTHATFSLSVVLHAEPANFLSLR